MYLERLRILIAVYYRKLLDKEYVKRTLGNLNNCVKFKPTKIRRYEPH